MKHFPLNLADLVPTEAVFYLSDNPEKPITLCRWSLRVRSWATAKYTPEGLKEIFEKQKIEEIADMAFFMLKDKTQFPNKEAFLDAIVTITDQINIIKALLKTVGIGEPEVEKIIKSVNQAPSAEGEISKAPKSKTKRKTSAKSLTR